MSTIHYFPRYSQKENMVTNNTLLLFSRLYNNSADKFKRFLNALFEYDNIEIDTTVQFRQQEKGPGSVPDGVIEQESFKIIIETKLYGQQDIYQVVNHWDSFGHENKKIFLWINKEPIEMKYKHQIINRLNAYNSGKTIPVFFASTTFKRICLLFNDTIQEYDIEMKELIQDYENFCLETGLIDNTDTKMRVILSGTTYNQNMKNNVYYAPSERGYQNYRYLGLYKDKAVRGIGEVISSADVRYSFDTDELIIEEVQMGTITDEQRIIIRNAIIEGTNEFGYSISKGHRFFFVKQFYETEFVKTSKGGLLGQKYFDLAEIDGFNKDMSTEQIAGLLRGKCWEQCNSFQPSS